MPKTLDEFQSLVEVVAQLRDPRRGCPWDLEQTHSTLTQYAIEETYEMVEAIETGSTENLVEELGDCLFQVLLHAQIGKDSGKFSIEDVISGVRNKMIERHPHVFASANWKSSEEVWKNWHRQKELQKKSGTKSRFSFPEALPALQAAGKIGVKTSGYGFDWPNWQGVWAKINEELGELGDELDQAKKQQNLNEELKQRISDEIGDALFSLSQLARHLKIDAESSLRNTNRRFMARFDSMLEISQLDRESFSKLSPDEKEALWRLAKIQEKKDLENSKKSRE